jgi:hypothetical protein
MRKAYILCPECQKPMERTTIARDFSTPVLLYTVVNKRDLPELEKKLKEGVAIEQALPWEVEQYLDVEAEPIGELLYCPYCQDYIELSNEKVQDYVVVLEKPPGEPFQIVHKGKALKDLTEKDILTYFAQLI